MKKLLSLILALCLTAGLIPVSVLAEYSENPTFVLTIEDLFTVTVPSGDDLIFDGNPKRVTVTPRVNDLSTEGIIIYYYNSEGVKDSPIHPGTYSTHISMQKTGNYDAIDEETHDAWEFTIVPASGTIETLFDVTVPTNRAFDGTTKEITVTPKEGKTGTGKINVLYEDEQGGTVDAPKFPGTYTPYITMEETEDYDGIEGETNPAWKYTIAPAPVTITGLTVSKEYDGTTEAINSYEGEATLSGVLDDYPVRLGGTLTGATFEDEKVGNNKKVTLTGLALEQASADDDYTDYYTLSNTIPGEITGIPVTITAKNQTVELGAEIVRNPDQVEVNGLRTGHTISYIGLIASETGAPTTTGAIQPVNAKIVDASNNEVTSIYAISYVNGVLTVNAPSEPIERMVIFQVEHGSWDDGTTADKSVTLTDENGEEPMLAAENIPAVGFKPDQGFKAGSWDPVPVAGDAPGEDKIYIYTYAQKESIAATVTFKVVNGTWNDGTTDDKIVPLNGYEGDTLKLADSDIPAVGSKPKDNGYKAGSWDKTPSTETSFEVSSATTYIYTYAPKESISATVTFHVDNGSWDDGTTADKTVPLTGLEGDTLKLATGDIPAVGSKPKDNGYKAGSWDETPSAGTTFADGAATTYTYTFEQKQPISATVTFHVANGTWDDGSATDKTVQLEGLENDPLQLADGDIPAVGTKPSDGYKAGSWDETPSTSTTFANGSATTYTYTYAQRQKISATVTFHVDNGTWDDGSTADKTVPLEGLENDPLQLATGDIPAVGNKPDNGFEADSWDETPSASTTFANGSATTYTYTYARKQTISATVTFKVANGTWDDGTTGDKSITLLGPGTEPLKLTTGNIPAVGAKPTTGYKAGSWNPAPSTDTTFADGSATTYTYTYAQKKSISATVTFKVANGSWDDGTADDQTVTLTGLEGDTLKLAATDIPAAGLKPGEGYKAGNWSQVPSAGAAVTADTTYTYTYIPEDTISAIVIFKVLNGAWGDKSTTDQTVTLTGPESNPLKLAAGDIPAVGTEPGEAYKAGGWDTTPSADTAFAAGSTTTYTYTYAQKQEISATVTFTVVNGAWGDGTTANKTVPLTGLEGDTLTLAAGEIPAVGTKPGKAYKAGGWDTAPVAGTAFDAGSATTYTYTYAQKDSISATVTFRVANGAWDDGTTADKTVTLTGLEGDDLTLAAGDIPTVGTKPGETYKAGGWDTAPSVNTEFTAGSATTCTYTYAEKEKITATVTFKVVNGSWDDETKTDKTVTLTGLEGDTLKLAAGEIPVVGGKPGEGFKAGGWSPAPAADTEFTAGSATTYTYTYIPEGSVSVTVTFKVLNGTWDDETTTDKTVMLVGPAGKPLKLAAGDIPAAGEKPVDGYKAGGWNPALSSDTEITADTTYTYTYAQKENVTITVTFKVVNGLWNNGKSEDKTVKLTGLEGEPVKLPAAKIPTAGLNPAEGYKAGGWDTEPSAETGITADTTYTYTYAQKQKISATVTFKVLNGTWNDETETDKTVTLTGLEDDTLTLAAGEIPAVGGKPDEGYKAGSWSPVLSAEKEITGDTVYTYAYIPEGKASATVTFKVLNGAWNDGTTADKTVMLVGPESDPLKLAAGNIPAVGGKPGEGYKAGGWDAEPTAGTEITEDTIYTYTYAQRKNISATVIFRVVNGAWDDGTTEDRTITLAGIEGDPPKLAAEEIPTAGLKPDKGYRAGGWSQTPSVSTEITGDTIYVYRYIETAEERMSITVTFRVKDGLWDDGTAGDKTVQLNGYSYEMQQQAIGAIPPVGGKPDAGYKAGKWEKVPSAALIPSDNDVYTYTYSRILSEGGNLVIYGLEKSYDFANTPIKPAFYVVDESRGVTLSLDTDYSVSYKNNKKVGTAIITVKGKKNYAGKNATVTFQIVDPKVRAQEDGKTLIDSKIKKITLSEKKFVYNGLAQYPQTVTIELKKDKLTLIATYNGKGGYDVEGLPEGETIAISVCNNVNKGTATLWVGTKTKSEKKTFKITPALLENVYFPDNMTAVWATENTKVDGFAVLWKNGNGDEVELVEGQDFKASFKFPKEAGTGTIKLTGKGNFTKKTNGTFTVNAFAPDRIDAVQALAGKKVSKVTVSIVDPSGKILKIKKMLNVKVLDENGSEISNRKLEAGEEITVVVTSLNLSKVYIPAEGLTETLTVGENFAKAKIKYDKKKFTKTYTGEPIELTAEDMKKVTVAFKNGPTLVYGVDYEIAGYQNNLKKGSMTVYLKGIGPYSGSAIKKMKVKIVSKSVE